MTRVVGIDWSLTSTGMARYDGTRAITTRITSKPKGDTLTDRRHRIRTLANQITGMCVGADLAVIEGPSYGSKDGAAHDRAGGWWMVVDRLHGLNIPVAEVPPGTLKKWLTGKGNTPKDQVLAAAIKRFPTVDVTGNDEADALGLCSLGARYLGVPFDTMPLDHQAALKAVRWPTTPTERTH